MLKSIIPLEWSKILIQGKLGSGKSDFTLWVLRNIIAEKGDRINRLLDNKESVLLLTEKVDQILMIEHDLLNRIYTVENISSKNPLDNLIKYNESFGIDILVIDYINLLNYQSHLMKDILEYIEKHNIKGIFIENTYKLVKEDLSLNNDVDYIIETSRGKHDLEVKIKKQKGRTTNTTFWISVDEIKNGKKKP